MFARCLWIGAGRLPVDELKSAKANEVNLLNKTTTLAHIAAEAGEDWEEILEQIAEEQELKDELGIKDEAEIEAAAGAPVASDDEDEATTDV